ARPRSDATCGDGTTITARSACWIRACETLPSRTDLNRVKPREPIRIAVAPAPSASRRIASAVVVSSDTVRGSASNPALRASSRSLGGALMSLLAGSGVDLLGVVGDARRQPKARWRAGQHARERLPHGEHNRRLAAQQLAAESDCRLRVLGAVVADQDHRIV